ncbi:hypothetical protein B0H19DRAFT_1382666 [Mycena capillaripes]|nr:hypothetical protein B0H19DRAFT_1382666 [Mycena capillaripes]
MSPVLLAAASTGADSLSNGQDFRLGDVTTAYAGKNIGFSPGTRPSRYVLRCDEEEEDCPPRSSHSSTPTGIPSIGGATPHSHSAVVTMALAAVLALILFTIASFFMWRYGGFRYVRRRLQPRPLHPPRSDTAIGGEILRWPPPTLVAGSRRAECAFAEQPPAVPPREVQDPPRPPFEAPPPAYEALIRSPRVKQEVDHLGSR